MAKTKALISFAVTAKLICVFVFAYAKSWFSHNEAQLMQNIEFYSFLFAGELNDIMITCPCNEDPPYTPLLYSETGVYMGIHFFLFLL